MAAPAHRSESYVVDRRGARRPVRFDEITARNEGLCAGPEYGPPLAAVDGPTVTADVAARFRNGMTTRELDAEAAAVCAQRSTQHSDYDWLAARIAVSDLHKRTPATLAAMAAALCAGAPDAASVRLSPEFRAIVERLARAGEGGFDAHPERDFRLRFFGFQTLARSYLHRPGARPLKAANSTLVDDQLMERPQHLYARVAIGVFLCQPDRGGAAAPPDVFRRRLGWALRFYDALSSQQLSNATPTLLNAGAVASQLSSCFQLASADDLAAQFDVVKAAAMISKAGGGVSVWLHSIRAEGSVIRSTGGRSTGVQKYVKILNDTQDYVDQGGKRRGAFAMYLELFHDDIFTFLRLPRLKGEEALANRNAPDLKYALWVPDLFMEALCAELEGSGSQGDPRPGPQAGDWYLFSPDEAPGLHLVYGEEYRALYARYVAEKRYRRKVKATEIIAEAFKTWAQVGVPYVMFKDAVNRKSNLQHVAPICSSNLCTEVLLPSWSAFDAADFARFHPENGPAETGVCNLGAVCLESFVRDGPVRPVPAVLASYGAPETSGGTDGAQKVTSVRAASVDFGPTNGVEAQLFPAASRVDFRGIAEAAGLEVRALDRVIDLTLYPSEDCRRSNQRHRPVGVGVMGLADVYARVRVAYGSEEAVRLARGIAAAVYFGALSASCALAAELGPHPSHKGSPMSRGLFQPDLWVACGHLAPSWERAAEEATGGAITAVDWYDLRGRVTQHGVRNAYVTAYMPTATTSNIVGQNECFEPFTSNIYTRQTLAGEFFVVNRHLMAELTERGLWDDATRRRIIAAGGSVQGLGLPADVAARYRTAREIHPTLLTRTVQAMAPFVCQSMSTNLFLSEPSLPKVLRFLVENWKAGMKCALYYLHTQPAAGSQKTSVRVPAPAAAPTSDSRPAAEAEEDAVCSRAAGCTSCAI